jgi:hypothetical protein
VLPIFLAMRMRSCLALGIIALMGCGTGPDDPDLVFYTFDLTASARDSTADRIRVTDCALSGSFTLARPVPLSGTVRFSVSITRSLDEHQATFGEFITADTSVSEAVLDYTGLGDDTLQFTFGAGNYMVTPAAGATSPFNPTMYSADWSCGPDFPLGQDSTLNAHGYDSNLAIPGLWRIQEILPIE